MGKKKATVTRDRIKDCLIQTYLTNEAILDQVLSYRCLLLSHIPPRNKQPSDRRWLEGNHHGKGKVEPLLDQRAKLRSGRDQSRLQTLLP